MATVGESLKANIRIGGNIDPSWKNSVEGLKEGVNALRRRSAALTAEQGKLAREIQAAALAGENISKLRREYEKLGQRIKVTTSEQDKLNASLESAERKERWIGRGRQGLAMTGGLMKTGAMFAGGGLLAAGAGVLASPAILNQQTAERAGIARSYGLNYGEFAAWEGVAKQSGLTGEHIGDMAEKLAQNIGAYKDSGKNDALTDGLSMLGLRAEDLKGMNNQQMMSRILDKASTIEDDQVASAAIDMLMGGEASKLITWLRMVGQNFSNMEKSQRRYNMVTDEGARGAVDGAMAVNNLWTVLGSGAQEISGLLGTELAPGIRNVTDNLATWFKGGGIESIKSIITDDIIPGLTKFGEGALLIGDVLFRAASLIDGFLPDEHQKKRDIVKSIGSTGSVDMARAIAKDKGQSEWFEKLLKDNPNLPNEVKQSYKSTRGFFSDDETAFDKTLDKYVPKKGRALDELKASFHSSKNSTPSSPGPLASLAYTPGQSSGITIRSEPRIDATFNITQQPGEDGSALAKRAVSEMGQMDLSVWDSAWGQYK